MAQQFRQELQTFVNCANSIDDLLPILYNMNLNVIKTTINQQFNHESDTNLRKTYYDLMSLEKILSQDVLQHILSFSGFHIEKRVNKKWKYLSEINEKHHLQKIYNSFTPNTKQNKIFIVDKHRNKRNSIEIDLGFDKLTNDINKALKRCKKGDKILIHDGLHDIQYDSIQDDIHLIGVGHNVVFHVKNGFSIRGFPCCKVYMENIQFTFTNSDSNDNETAMYVQSSSNLTMKNCSFKFPKQVMSGIRVMNASILMLSECYINGGAKGVEISPIARGVHISNCVFENCGVEDEIEDDYNGCIVVNDYHGDCPYTGTIYEQVNDGMHRWIRKLICVGNKFKNNSCYPILEISNEEEGYFIYDKVEKCILKDNRWEGYDIEKRMDANIVYHESLE
eukprot:302394_1